MSRNYRDDDVDLLELAELTVTIVGYGNQGRPQTLNLLDSGVERVLVANREDDYRDQAIADGHTVHPIPEAVAAADIVSILIPDEVQPQVFRELIGPALKPGQTIIFGHGYNVFYGTLNLRADVDVCLVAPRMVGELVRSHYESGEGSPALVAVERDATGRAWQRTLAYAKAIGSTRAGALETSFEEETVVDLFAEQAFGALLISTILSCYETLEAAGYNPEIVYTELAGSGEMAEVFGLMSRVGVTRQLWHHSRVSNYGQLSRAQWLRRKQVFEPLSDILHGIRDGSFAREWAMEQIAGYPGMNRLHQDVRRSSWFEQEDRHLGYAAATEPEGGVATSGGGSSDG